MEENDTQGMKAISICICILIILDFFLFYLTFFNTFWPWIDKNKGVPFTLMLFVSFLIYYLSIHKKERSNDFDLKEINESLANLTEQCMKLSEQCKNLETKDENSDKKEKK